MIRDDHDWTTPEGSRVRFWWVFNIADMGVTVGAAILAWIAWRADHAAVAGGDVARPGAG